MINKELWEKAKQKAADELKEFGLKPCENVMCCRGNKQVVYVGIPLKNNRVTIRM